MISLDMREITGGFSCWDEQGLHCTSIAHEYGSGSLSTVTPLQRDIFLVSQDFTLYGDGAKGNEEIQMNRDEESSLPLLAFSVCLCGVNKLCYDHPRISMGEGFSDIVIAGHRECLAMTVESNTPVQTFDVCMSLTVFEQLTGRSSSRLIADLQQLDLRAERKVRPKRSKELDMAQRICGQQLFAACLEQPGDMLFLEAKSLELAALQLRQLDFLMGNLSQKTKTACYSRQILSASEILRDELASPPSVLELSRRVGLNHNQLTQGFRQIFGQTPFEYLRTIRLEKAHALLISGKHNVTEAAFEVGYSSLSHFSGNFHREFGVNPKTLQKRRTA